MAVVFNGSSKFKEEMRILLGPIVRSIANDIGTRKQKNFFLKKTSKFDCREIV
jgi:hypothetical protein